ncbi:ABC transporter ATP-binding protein [Ethanoligenens harbinense]|uniref:ABC transporter related protein n=1 Tax=Ethanoligenens harbinense (strain DSM 18485 / JCM 12961 / CGMCC 1.5033 / YUAN-3) TaxID=663278 RepID=E6U9I2_ETHHY|nr:ABC transporter ATP-binding protein [Ethanoligenens harbinense]ADU26173.1 ABC transporter related protein [Ethanoligenens harbinense YUAN-3]
MDRIMADNTGEGASGVPGGFLELRGVTKRYPGRVALRGATFSIPRGRIVGLLGPNGAGKTTLIKILAGILGGYEGTVRIDGQVPGAYTKSIVSYLPDRSSLPHWMRISDAVAFFSDFYADFDRAKAMELIGRLRLNPAERIAKLSKGTCEKVQLVLAMSRTAGLYVLDEPIGGVDPAARDVIMDTILTQYCENSTLLLSTQIIGDVERVFNSVIFLRNGEVILNEEVDAVRERYKRSVDGLFREVFKCC